MGLRRGFARPGCGFPRRNYPWPPRSCVAGSVSKSVLETLSGGTRDVHRKETRKLTGVLLAVALLLPVSASATRIILETEAIVRSNGPVQDALISPGTRAKLRLVMLTDALDVVADRDHYGIYPLGLTEITFSAGPLNMTARWGEMGVSNRAGPGPVVHLHMTVSRYLRHHIVSSDPVGGFSLLRLDHYFMFGDPSGLVPSDARSLSNFLDRGGRHFLDFSLRSRDNEELSFLTTVLGSTLTVPEPRWVWYGLLGAWLLALGGRGKPAYRPERDEGVRAGHLGREFPQGAKP